MSTVKIKRSGTTTSTPSSLDHGELAINYADATLFWKDATNTIKSFVFQAYASATHKSQHATGGSDALTPSDIGAAPAASPAITGNATFQASSGVPVTITNTGTGNSFVVNDAAGDTTPFVVDADGKVGIGSSQTFGVSSRLHVADTGVSSTAVVTIQGTAAGTSASPLVPSSLVFRNFQFDTSAANARQLVRIDALSREQAVATGAAVFYCSNSSGVATEYFRIDPHLNGCISALPLVTPAGTAAAPAIVSGTGTSDTGLFWPAADTVAISTAGGERVRVRSDGNVAIGGTGSASSQLNIQSALTGGTAVNGIYSSQTVSSDVTSAASVFRTFVGTQNASFTLPTLVHFNASANTFGASSTVTTQVGFLAGSTLTGATSNYGFQGSIASGSGRYNLYMSGTADNYLAGNVGIGSSRTSPASALDVNGVITVAAGTAAAPAIVASGDSNTGLAFATDTLIFSTAGVERVRVRSDGNVGIGSAGGSNAGLWLQPTLSSASDRYGIYGRITGTTDSTSPIYTCSTFADLQASASTSLAVNYQAIRPQLAAGASVTTAVGLMVQSSFTVATNNYGVQLSIGSGSGRWNIYADGTAQNYFAGNVGIGSGNTTPSAPLHVVGESKLIGPITEGRVVGGNTGTAKTIALTNGTLQDYTLTGNCTFTMPTATSGQSFTIMLRTGAGSYTATFTGVKWPGSTSPTVTATASRMDLFSFVSDGTNWYGSVVQGYTP